ncbi:MAG: sulfatase-like hydrolase/transferase [Terriglobia bacterium]|jgi:arylsulfatase A-like enzyme
METWHRIRTIAIILLAILAVGPASRSYGQTPATAPYNILLLTPDQMGADFMHTYGYPSPNTPNLDELAREGVVFTHGYSAGSWTTPSFGSILTGMFPTVHGMTLPPLNGCGGEITRALLSGNVPPVPDFLTLSPQKLVLPQLLKPYGMATGVDLANCWAIWDVAARSWDDIKLMSGTQVKAPEFPDLSNPHYLTAPLTLAWAQQWLTAHRDQRFFLWLHFMEPHSPYNPPREYDRFKTLDDYPTLYDDNRQDAHELTTRAILGDSHAINRLRQLYAAKIMYADHYLGEVFKTLTDLGLRKNTIIVLVSDHGELMFSHPQDFNMADHRSVYDMVQHVPLMIWAPNVRAGRRVDALAGHYDLLPTIFDLEGLPIPSQVDGKSLKPVLDGSATEVNHYVYGEVSLLDPQYSIRDQRYKLIESLRSGRIQCFDLLTDPGETHDACNALPEVAAELKQALDAHLQYMVAKAKSFSDWENNQSLAVIEQRDSRALQTLAPATLTINPPVGGASLQVSSRLWSLVKDSSNCRGQCIWAPPGPGTASAIWRFDYPLTGDYEISVWYGSQADQYLATDANFIVHFKGGSLAFPFDQNHNQGQWNLLGRFHDPTSVELNNRANGIVVAGPVKLTLVSTPEAPKSNFLASDPSGWVDLMPHESLEGWTRMPVPAGKALDPINQWSLDKEHRTILCEGNHGHEWLRYDHELTNFLLHVEWRFEKDREGRKGYNSGVFVRNDLTGRVWHQAQVGATAYIFGQTLIHGELSPMIKTPPPVVNPLHPIGDWNTYEIRCDGPKITFWVNGELTGEFAAPEVPKGYWGLEAEGYRIEFRNIKLKVLP